MQESTTSSQSRTKNLATGLQCENYKEEKDPRMFVQKIPVSVCIYKLAFLQLGPMTSKTTLCQNLSRTLLRTQNGGQCEEPWIFFDRMEGDQFTNIFLILKKLIFF
jgi:hypothetical protein